MECIGAPGCHLLLMRVECCIYPQFGTGTEEKEWVKFVFVCQYRRNTRPPPNYPEDVGEGVDLSEGFNHDLATIICIVRDR